MRFPWALWNMVKQVITSVAVLVATALQAIPGSSPPDEPYLVCRRAERDLGEVQAGRLLAPTFSLENSGPVPVVLQHLVTGADNITLQLLLQAREHPLPKDPLQEIGLEIPPGGIVYLKVKITTAGLTGKHECHVEVQSSDPNRPVLPIKVAFVASTLPVKRPEPPPKRDPPPEPTGPQPKLVSTEREVDLGEVTAGEKESHTFVIRNEGEAGLRVTNIKTVCGCAIGRGIFKEREELDFDRLESGEAYVLVSPGEELSIRIEIDAATTKEGPLEEKITVYTNDPACPAAVFKATATVSRGYTLEPKWLGFPPTPKGHVLEGSMRLELTRLGSSRVTAVTSPESFIEVAWSELAESPPGGTKPEATTEPDATVAASGAEPPPARYRFDIRITGSAPGGRISRFVEVKTNHERVPLIKLPIIAQIIPNITFKTANPANPEMIDFGIVSTSEPIVRDIEIVNSEPELPYFIKEIEVSSTHKDLIKVDVETLEPGTHYRLKVALLEKPKARMVLGAIIVRSDHVDLPQKEIRFRAWIIKG
ncbi:MAG: DUF1573 domain-containing protein [Planctomycetota bacterium]